VNQESSENQRERYDDRNENRTKGHLGLRKDRVHGEDRSGDVRHTTAQRITARDKHVMGMGHEIGSGRCSKLRALAKPDSLNLGSTAVASRWGVCALGSARGNVATG